ncbi:protocadherin-1-like [Zophobas morio]|uniref:protocadherin-1-like n=1 Tax=Zophobas morio TaxID=2755281 RepID=UPI003083C070
MKSVHLVKILCALVLHVELSMEVSVLNARAGEGTIFEGPDCYMIEGVAINVNNSICIFSVSNNQGHLGSINFTIKGNSNESDIFEFQYKEPPSETDLAKIIYLVLKEGHVLDYDTTNSYKFDVEVKGAVLKVPVTVKVYKAPKFTSIPAFVDTYEEQAISFKIATELGSGYPKDDDVAVVIVSTVSPTINRINRNTLNVTLPPIDRETQDNFYMDVIASYRGSMYGETRRQVPVMIYDIDDNIPKIKYDHEDTLDFSISQNGSSVLVTDFSVSDPDEGVNAAYKLTLIVPANVQPGFELSSLSGSGDTSFNITLNPQKLDYSKSVWGRFQLQVHVEGILNATQRNNLFIIISLNEETDSGSGCVRTSEVTLFLLLIQCWWYFM